MRIRAVTAHAFGPLAGETLEFADGMTVVVGDNESAKSSWHAAIYAALCGRRRGRGRPREDEQRFIDLHRPWEREDWLVSAEIALDDARRVELRQDLAGRVDCHAKDLDLGEDVSSEVMNEGAPDAARWLGLDRSSFTATACVEQAQMLRIRAEADGLRQHLQRAAATAGADRTAAAALAHIAAFEREQVGLERANSTRPLRRAIDGLERAQARVDRARESHQEYLRLAERADALRNEAAGAQASVLACEAAAAGAHAAELAHQAQRAADLHDALDGKQPPSATDDDALAQKVSEALATWWGRPDEPVLSGPGARELQGQIDSLPPAPSGDLEPHESVANAFQQMRDAQGRLDQHDSYRPPEPGAPAAVGASEEELADLARTLETPPPSVDPGLAAQEEEARARLGAGPRGSLAFTLALAGAAAAAAAGVALLVSVSLIAGVALLAVAAGLAVVAFSRRGSVSASAAFQRHAELKARLDQATSQADTAKRQRADAVRRCEQLGLEPDPATLRAAARSRAQSAAHVDDLREWSQRRQDLMGQVVSAASAVAAALARRGHPPASADPDGLAASLAEYRQACAQRAEQAQQARQRDSLVSRLNDRRAAEARAEQDRQKRAEAARLVAEAGSACGFPPAPPADTASELGAWQEQRKARTERLAAAQNDWAELRALLNGRTLPELRDEAQTAGTHAAALAARVDPAHAAAADPATAEARLAGLREAASKASVNAATAEGELRRFAAHVTSVAEAEEALEEAQAERDRVRELGQTLALTRQFLQNAQDRVHRDIAPALAATLKQWLPTVTGGRYTDLTVNPATLQVEVCGPTRSWRQADLLSRGTAEQIYLLLRIALADHLTRGHDTCPLILDDVTVHADSARTRHILDLLLAIAEDRQVILFTQEDHVARWAHDRLASPSHKICHLDPVPVS